METYKHIKRGRRKRKSVAAVTYMTCTTAPQPDMASRSTALSSACEIVSNKSFGSYTNPQKHIYVKLCTNCSKTTIYRECLVEKATTRSVNNKRTRSGSQRASHMPCSWSVHVPLTTKSSVSIGQPMRSREAMYGLFVLGSRPATTGSTKYGPNLCHTHMIMLQVIVKCKLNSISINST